MVRLELRLVVTSKIFDINAEVTIIVWLCNNMVNSTDISNFRINYVANRNPYNLLANFAKFILS